MNTESDKEEGEGTERGKGGRGERKREGGE